jgi:transcriptional regulator of met regulon
MHYQVSICLFIIGLCSPALRAEEPAKEPLPKETVSKFAENVLLHVVLHETGHGLIREFDLPILGNEETMADAFATHYLTQYLPDRAFDVLKARTDSLMIEAKQVPRELWSVQGEHDNDARRAFQIAALAVAADPKKYSPIAKGLGMTEGEIRKAADYGAEIHRSWRRTLVPLLMPSGQESRETRVTFDPSCQLAAQIRDNGLAAEIATAIKRFDWHSQVTVAFEQGDGGAAWSRSTRTISVKSEYVRRFIEQGKNGKP